MFFIRFVMVYIKQYAGTLTLSKLIICSFATRLTEHLQNMETWFIAMLFCLKHIIYSVLKFSIPDNVMKRWYPAEKNVSTRWRGHLIHMWLPRRTKPVFIVSAYPIKGTMLPSVSTNTTLSSRQKWPI